MFKSIKMKRILSIIIAVVMITLLVPTEFLSVGKVYAATGQEIVDDALSFAVPTDSYGRPTQAPKVNYVFGGLDLSVGVDCSGFVCAIFKRHGIDLVSMGIRSSYDMYDNASKFGTKVETDTDTMLKDIKTGDILVTNGTGHVGIAWVNNGTVYMIHAGNTSTGVIYQTLSSYGYSKLVAVIHVNGVTSTTTVDTSEDTGEVGTEDTNPGHPYSIPSGEVKSGSNANRVRWVQKAMNTIKNSGLTVDGSFSTATTDAVKAFQKENGLKETGTANQETIDLIITYFRNYRDVTAIEITVNDADKIKTKSSSYKTELAERTTESTDATDDSTTDKKDTTSETDKTDETKKTDEQFAAEGEGVSLKIGETYTISTKITPDKAIRKTLKYTSSNADVISVDDTGKVTAKSTGEAEITVTAASGVTAKLFFKIEGSIYSSEWVDGQWYDKDGEPTYKPTGKWMKNWYGWWYQDTSGWYPSNMWQKINGDWYYFDASGYMVSNGWRNIGGTWYYFHKSGNMASSEWIDGYWLSSSGAWSYYYTGYWRRDGNGWWYEDTSGWYPTDMYQTIDGVKYHFNSSGYWDY